MRLFINLDSRQLVNSVTDSQEVTSLALRRGDKMPLDLYFSQAGLQTALSSTSFGINFTAKESGDYDGNEVLSATAFTLVGSGTTAYYAGVLDLSGTTITNLVPTDTASVTLHAEIEWLEGVTYRTTSKAFSVAVNNDIRK
jgi:hypothetical protein